MRRREFIAGFGGAVAAWPVAAWAQQPKMPVIGFLHAGSIDGAGEYLRAFGKGLGETGYVEGRNVAIEYRWADGRSERLRVLATDLARRQVTVIIASGSTLSAQAAVAATTTIPVVFHIAADPVDIGLVGSLNRPGANCTGITTFSAELVPKRLELLHEVVPKVAIISVLLNPTNTRSPSGELQAAARALGLQLDIVRASTERELDTVLASLGQLQGRALMIPPDLFFLDRRAQLGALTLRHAIPAIHSYRAFAAAGGLMTYGGSLTEQGHEVGIYAGRILNGEKPTDLPVQQVTKVELIINLKTARALGLTFPLPLLGRADEVIE